MSVERTAIVVLSTVYALFVGMVVYWVRHPAPRRQISGTSRGAPLRDLIRYVAVLAAGGYLAFLAVVVVFHIVVAGERSVLGSALWGGALLDFAVAAPTFVLAAWLGVRRSP